MEWTGVGAGEAVVLGLNPATSMFFSLSVLKKISKFYSGLVAVTQRKKFLVPVL